MLRFWCRICDLWFCVYCRPRSLDVQENLLIRIHSLWAITVGKEIWKLQIRNCVKKYAAHHFDFWSTHIGSGSTPCCEDMSIMEPSVNITVLLSIHIQSRIYKWNIFPFVLYWSFPLPQFPPWNPESWCCALLSVDYNFYFKVNFVISANLRKLHELVG